MLSNIIREGRILLLAVAASVIAANVAASDGGRDNISPSVGDVLLEATDSDPIRVLVSKFHRNAARKLATLVARGIAAKLDFEGLP